MLGVEVFRDKQGQGGKPRDAEREEKDEENEGAGANDEEEAMDSQNGGENGSLEAKAGGEGVDGSS